MRIPCEEGGPGESSDSAEADEGVNADAIDNEAEENASHENGSPVEGDPATGGFWRNVAAFGEDGEGPLPQGDFEAGVDEEEDDLQPDDGVAQSVGGGDFGRGLAFGGGFIRRGVVPLFFGGEEEEGEEGEGEGDDEVTGAEGVGAGDRGGHDDGAEHGAEAITGMEPIHVASGEMMRDVMVEAGINGARAEAVEERAEGEEGPDGGEEEVEPAEGDKAAAEGEEDPDVEDFEEPSSEKTGEEIAASSADKNPGDVRLLELKSFAHGGPGYADQCIRETEADEPEIANEQEERALFSGWQLRFLRGRHERNEAEIGCGVTCARKSNTNFGPF